MTKGLSTKGTIWLKDKGNLVLNLVEYVFPADQQVVWKYSERILLSPWRGNSHKKTTINFKFLCNNHFVVPIHKIFYLAWYN